MCFLQTTKKNPKERLKACQRKNNFVIKLTKNMLKYIRMEKGR